MGTFLAGEERVPLRYLKGTAKGFRSSGFGVNEVVAGLSVLDLDEVS